MKRHRLAAWLIASIAPVIALAVRADAGDLPAPTDWTIHGARRQALVVPPDGPGDGPVPLVLVFHGHGGTMGLMARKGFQEAWPEALFVFPQGLPTSTPRDPAGYLAGWQNRVGADGDRDLAFVDAILETLQTRYRIDPDRVYATGHSNGGSFTYLLWAARGSRLAAIAPSSAPAAALLGTHDLKPIPVLHLAGRRDAIIPFANQELSMRAVRRVNRCDDEGKPWASAGRLTGTLYPSTTGAPVVALVHPGGHVFPREAPGLIVRFLRKHSRQPAAERSSGGRLLSSRPPP